MVVNDFQVWNEIEPSYGAVDHQGVVGNERSLTSFVWFPLANVRVGVVAVLSEAYADPIQPHRRRISLEMATSAGMPGRGQQPARVLFIEFGMQHRFVRVSRPPRIAGTLNRVGVEEHGQEERNRVGPSQRPSNAGLVGTFAGRLKSRSRAERCLRLQELPTEANRSPGGDTRSGRRQLAADRPCGRRHRAAPERTSHREPCASVCAAPGTPAAAGYRARSPARRPKGSGSPTRTRAGRAWRSRCWAAIRRSRRSGRESGRRPG